MEESFAATEIKIGQHPHGYRIDKTATPMNRYTHWRITDEGIWVDPTPVCFDSMPQEGWTKAEGFDWDMESSEEHSRSDIAGPERISGE